jgi:toxin-antitoxin system PIN domain toxin
MTATLLDGNILVALTVADHVHHDAAESWFEDLDGAFATCPITQGTLVRLLVRQGQSGETAKAVVTALTGNPRHELWLDEISYGDVPLKTVIGHRQVTDAYLAELARTHGGRLASFDQGMADVHTDVVELVPTAPT